MTDPGPMAGGMLLYHPLIDATNYVIHEIEYRRSCCSIQSSDFCANYATRRPISDGTGYEAPVVGMLCVKRSLEFSIV